MTHPGSISDPDVSFTYPTHKPFKRTILCSSKCIWISVSTTIPLIHKIEQRQDSKKAMKNLMKVSALLFALTATQGWAAVANEKSESSRTNTTLPSSAPAIEIKGPEVKHKEVKKMIQYSPEQKASIVELKITGMNPKK